MKKPVVILAGAVLVAGVVVTHLWLDLRAGREQSREQMARLAALESAQLAQAAMPPPLESVEPPPVVEEPMAPSPAAVARPQAAERRAEPATASQPAVRQQPDRPDANPLMAGVLESMNTPEGREIMRGLMGMMYPDVAQELDLTAEETEKLFDLLARQQQALGAESLGLMTGGQGDLVARQEMQRKLVEMERAYEAELTALLGSKYPKWEEYQSTTAARQQVDQLRTALGASGNPLSEAQSTQLVAAFAAEQKRMTQDERNWTSSPAALNSPNMVQESMQRAVEGQRRLVDVAAAHLSAAQLDQYRRQVEQQVSMMSAMMGMMGGQAGPP